MSTNPFFKFDLDLSDLESKKKESLAASEEEKLERLNAGPINYIPEDTGVSNNSGGDWGNLPGSMAAAVIGLIIAFMVLRWAFRKTKLISKKVTNKSQEISIIVQNKVDEARRNRVSNNIAESALDEIVREAVRQAMREGIRPDEINICPKCLGEGCVHCDEKGWDSN